MLQSRSPLLVMALAVAGWTGCSSQIEFAFHDAASGGPGVGGGSVAEDGGQGGAPEGEASSDAPNDASTRDCAMPSQCILKSALVHRYTFDGTGIRVADSVGTAHGNAMNVQLAGDGTLALAGGFVDIGKQYVNLPDGMIRELTDATFEIWVTWSGGAPWQHLFNFGNNDQFGALTSFYLTPLGGNPEPQMFAAFKRSDQAGSDETRVISTTGLASGVMVHLAVVINDDVGVIRLYSNGNEVGTIPFSGSLSQLDDVNNWLGRSPYFVDPGFAGTIHEFRIYNIALGSDVIQASYRQGPDPAFLK